MGRFSCCDQKGLKKGSWTPEEDLKLLAYIEQHGHGSWRALPAKAGLQRCGKSCRLRWINYLRPDIKRGKFSLQEEQTIIQLHALLGNRWSVIAAHLPKRTDNEIKNHWNTHLKKRLARMGIDPVTHKPKTDSLAGAHSSRDIAILSHMAQWESARLEAEARWVRDSKLLGASSSSIPSVRLQQPQLTPSTPPSAYHQLTNKATMAPRPRPQCLDVLKAWEGIVSGRFMAIGTATGVNVDVLESPTSTLSFLKSVLPVPATGFNANLTGDSVACGADGNLKDMDRRSYVESNQMLEWEERLDKNNSVMPLQNTATYENDGAWFQSECFSFTAGQGLTEGPWELLGFHGSGEKNSSVHFNNNGSYGGDVCGNEDSNSHWYSELVNLVNASPPDSPLF